MDPPSKGWATLNIDGAARGNLGSTGIRCIINNDTGKWIVKKAMAISPTSNNLVELEALEEGLNLSLQLGLSNLI